MRRSALLLTVALAGCVAPWIAPARSGSGGAVDAGKLLASMTLEEKVGQVMVVAFDGTSVTPAAAQMVRDYHAGGVILFQQNLQDAAQVRSVTGQLQTLAKVPLLIGVDQEGGPVVRVTQGVTIFPSEMAIGATFSPQVAGQVAGQTARELKALGINVNFSPVVDVNSNPNNPVIGVRSYGADPAQVGRMAVEAIRASQQAGVLSVAKHFPGHGDADVDSHKALPVIGQDMEHLKAVELPPFQAAIGAGVDAIMTAHVLMPALEPDANRPATLSGPVMSYLREQLGYSGLIITDDLEMGAIVNDYGTAEAAVLAFKAGADLLLFRRNVAEQQRAHGLLVAAVKNGEISQARLDQSVRRVLEAKVKRGVVGSPASDVRSPATPPAAQAGEALAVEVGRKGLTLVKNDGGVLPLKASGGGQVCVVYPRPEQVNGVEIGLPATGVNGPLSLGDAMAAVLPQAKGVAVSLRATAEETEAALACARNAQTVVVGTYNLNEYPALARLYRSVVDVGKPTVVVALRLPYDLAQLERAPALLATYSNRPASLRALAEALVGKGPAPAGHLPVPVSAKWPLGYGVLDWERVDKVGEHT